MLLDRNYDKVVLGKNYLSLLSSIILGRNGERVLLIDDGRVMIDKLWGNYFSEIEKDYLQLCGIVYNIEPFVGIDRFLKRINICLNIDQRYLALGNTPYDNLLELSRKFPDVIDPKILNNSQMAPGEFNEQFYLRMDRFAELLFRFKSYQTVDQQIFDEIDLPLLKRIRESFKSSYKLAENPENIHLRSFFTAIKGYFHLEAVEYCSAFELDHLLLCLLSPQYCLDTDKLEIELETIFEERHGALKQTRVHSWQIYKGKLTHFELESFEGVVGPEDSLYMGHLCSDIPFALNPPNDYFKTAEVVVYLKDDLFKLDAESIIYTSSHLFCSDLPLVFIRKSSSRSIVLEIPYKDKLGVKPSFYRAQLIELAKEAIESSFFISLENKDISFEILQGKTYLVDRRFQSFESQRAMIRDFSKVYELQRPGEQERISGVEYWGPQRISAVGLLSYLMELRDHLH